MHLYEGLNENSQNEMFTKNIISIYVRLVKQV